MLELYTCYLSETGGRQRNEDACGFWTTGISGCWILSDGAGGHGSGDVASQLVVKTTLQSFRDDQTVSPESATLLLQAAQDAVVHEKSNDSAHANMHATATVLLIDKHQETAVWGHVGDSRIYLFRSDRLLLRSIDHSLVQQMLDAGLLNGDPTREHPKRSILMSAIGCLEDLFLSVSEPTPLIPGDRFLICTDGWWEYVLDAEMEALSQTERSPERWLAEMAELVRNRAPSGHDNYTAIAIEVRLDDETTVLR